MIFCVIHASYGEAVGCGININAAYENACDTGDSMSDDILTETEVTFWEATKKLPVDVKVNITFENREI